MLYVNMVDASLSRWGHARNGRSLLSVKCETLEQAEAIEKAAHDRPEMQYVAISQTPRRMTAGDHRSIKRFADLGPVWKGYYREAA